MHSLADNSLLEAVFVLQWLDDCRKLVEVDTRRLAGAAYGCAFKRRRAVAMRHLD